MVKQQDSRLNWKMPLVGMLAALGANLPAMFFGNDLLAFLGTAILFAAAGIALLAFAAVNVRRQTIAALLMLTAFCLFGWLFFKLSYDIYSAGRWLAHSARYKAEVLAQAQPPNKELKHIEWDGWGFAGTGDTTVYLVFDPDDHLAKNYEGDSGPPPGIACKVWRIHRLESRWYAVTFYTDTHWDQCE